MIYIECFEDIISYHYSIIEGCSSQIIMYMKVQLDEKKYNYYQQNDTIIISDSELYNKLDYMEIIPLKKHLNWINLCRNTGVLYYVKINGVVIPDGEYEFVDITRTLKLKKIINNDKFRNIIKTNNQHD
jgi:hypothetical protein